MKRHWFYVLFSAAILSGFVGAARAELAESPPPSQPTAKVDQPAPVSRPSHAAASRRIVAERRPVATLVTLRTEPACTSLACGRYTTVGIAFGF